MGRNLLFLSQSTDRSFCKYFHWNSNFKINLLRICPRISNALYKAFIYIFEIIDIFLGSYPKKWSSRVLVRSSGPDRGQNMRTDLQNNLARSTADVLKLIRSVYHILYSHRAKIIPVRKSQNSGGADYIIHHPTMHI